MNKKYYAHSLPGEPPKKWHLLEEYLQNGAEPAKSFAEDLGAGNWAYQVGLWYENKIAKKIE